MPPLISTKKINHVGPTDADILIVGEAPTYEEDKAGMPFVDDRSQCLHSILAGAGITRANVRFANICNYRPTNDDFRYLQDSEQLAEGLREIRDFISSSKTLRLVILLGEKPLNFLANKYGIHNWRGSVISGTGNVGDPLITAAYHPHYTTYNPEAAFILAFDIQKVVGYYRLGYKKPIHDFVINPKGMDLEECVNDILKCKKVAVDIEGVKKSFRILCCGFAVSSTRAYCFVNTGYTGLELSFYNACRRILEDERIEKVFQNGFGYDVEVFRQNGIEVKNYSFDTMIAAHVLDPEMPKGLDFLTSLYTDEPYYKDKGKGSIPEDEKGWSEKFDKDVLYDYNCIDCITTFQVAEGQERELKERKLWDIFKYKMSLCPVALDFTRTGMPIDPVRLQELRDTIEKELAKNQLIFDNLCGQVGKSGQLVSVNVNSKIVLPDVLYNKFKLPPRRNRGSSNLTTDEDAIVSLIAFCQDKIQSSKMPETIFEWKKKLLALKLLLKIREGLKLKSTYLGLKKAKKKGEEPLFLSDDGRLRSVYRVVGTVGSRWACSSYIDGTGLNGQTMPRGSVEV